LSDVISPIPDLPPGLAEAALRGRLIPFIGAGASIIAGCPNWSDFADRALRFFVEQGKFSHGQLDQIKHLHPRVKLSLAMGFQKEHRLRIDFENVLHPDGRRDSPKGRRLYEALSKLGKTFVTTNYDRWLDSEIGTPVSSVHTTSASTVPLIENSRTVVHRVHDLTAYNLNKPNTVIHLHGSLLDPENMILTTQHYVRHYANDRLSSDAREENNVLTFLGDLFTQKTVLFVGYGLEELEILEYVIGKADLRQGKEGSKEIRHYLLQGFFAHERELMRSFAGYYREFGIQLLPFLRDQKNWDQLIDVLEEFARRAPVAELMKSEKLLQMEDLLNG
jgi:hypothetical protein